jgi:hypothetical protein
MTSGSFHESFLLYPKGKFKIFLKIKENNGSHEYTDPMNIRIPWSGWRPVAKFLVPDGGI